MNPTRTVSVGIAANAKSVYGYASDPANLPQWAPGFVQSIERQGTVWVARTSLGEAIFRFAPTNDLGVLDHDVQLAAQEFHNPMRVIPDGDDSVVMFTLVQLPGISGEQFEADARTVLADLHRLRDLLQQQA